MRPSPRLTRHWPLALVLAAYLVLSLYLSMAIPLWESDDEWGHYPYVRYIATHFRLPPAEVALSGMDDESKLQPPLYYVLAALVSTWFRPESEPVVRVNPWWTWYNDEATGWNRALHSADEAFPYSGGVLAVHGARLASVAFGAAVVVLVYASGMLVFLGSRSLAVAAAAVAAFTPGVLVKSAVVSNDIGVTAFAALVLLLLLLVVVRGPRAAYLVGFWLAVAAAVLTKVIALGLVVAGVVVVGTALWVRREGLGRRGLMLGALFAVLGLVVVIVLLNLRIWGHSGGAGGFRYRDLLFSYLAAPSRIVTALDWRLAPRELWGLFDGYWVRLGHGQVPVARALRLVPEVLFAIAVVAAVRHALRGGDWRARLILLALAATIVSVLAPPFLWGLRLSRLAPARFLLPAAPAVSLLLIWGPTRWGGPRLRQGVGLFLGTVFLGLAAYVSLVVLPPLYRPPERFRDAVALEFQHPTGANFGGKATLVGYSLSPSTVAPGGTVDVTLTWEVSARMEEDYALAVKLLAPDGQLLAWRHSYPGNGNYATSRWQPGEFFQETYPLRVDPAAEAPVAAWLSVSLFRYPDGVPLPVLDDSGETVGGDARVGRVVVRREGAALPAAARPAAYRLGGAVELSGWTQAPEAARAGQPLEVTLYWRAVAAVGEDYTVFLHLVDASGRPIVQDDSPPRRGAYPTGLWREGELVADRRALLLPPDLEGGEYRLVTGMYHPATGERLLVSSAAGEQGLRDHALLGIVAVENR